MCVCVCVCVCICLSAPFRPLRVKVSPKNDTNASSRQEKRIKLAIFFKMLRSKVMASFAHFVGVRRSCRALQFILTATDAAIATQKPNGKLNTASFCQHGRSLPSPPEISAFYSRLNHAYMHPLEPHVRQVRRRGADCYWLLI